MHTCSRSLKGAVLDEGLLLVAADLPALGGYLRPVQKVWSDQRHRARLVGAEAARLLHGVS